MPLLALLLVTAIWGVTFVQVKDAVQNGGTPGSPVGPLLYSILRPGPSSAPAGQSPASPSDNTSAFNEEAK
jgi:hypothetical protein